MEHKTILWVLCVLIQALLGHDLVFSSSTAASSTQTEGVFFREIQSESTLDADTTLDQHLVLCANLPSCDYLGKLKGSDTYQNTSFEDARNKSKFSSVLKKEERGNFSKIYILKDCF